MDNIAFTDAVFVFFLHTIMRRFSSLRIPNNAQV